MLYLYLVVVPNICCIIFTTENWGDDNPIWGAYVLNGWLNPQRVVLSFYQGRKMKDGCSVETKITKISWSVLCRVKKMSWTTIFVMMVGPFSKTGSLMTSIVSRSKQRRAEILDIIDAGNVEKWLTTPSRIGVCGAKSSFFPTSYAMTGMYVLKTNHL